MTTNDILLEGKKSNCFFITKLIYIEYEKIDKFYSWS